jgi:hypothetical protein
MPGVDQQALRVAADSYRTARQQYAAAKVAAHTAYQRLQASPETLEYQIDWNVTRREEAAAAERLRQAAEAYRKAGGYLSDEDE